MCVDRRGYVSVRCGHEDHAGYAAGMQTLRVHVAPAQGGRADLPALQIRALGHAQGMRHARSALDRRERRTLRTIGRALCVLGFGLIFCVLALLLGA